MSRELFTINDSQSLRWGIYTYKMMTDSRTPCGEQGIQITPQAESSYAWLEQLNVFFKKKITPVRIFYKMTF